MFDWGGWGWFPGCVDEVKFFTYPAQAHGLGAGMRHWGIRVNGDDLRLIAAEATRDFWLAQSSRDGSENSDEYMTQFVLAQYGSLWTTVLGPPSRMLFGEMKEGQRWTEGLWVGRTPLLGCGGCVGWECWPLLAAIGVDDRVVTWSTFVQPRRERWGELEIGPYTFDRAVYEAAMAEPDTLDADPVAALLQDDKDHPLD